MRRTPRRGTVLILVLCCLVVATSVLLSSVGASLRQQRQCRLDRQMVQTQWLLDAGVRVAAKKIEQQPGEDRIEFSTEDGLADYDGVIVIEVIKRLESAIEVNVTARLERGAGVPSATQSSHRFWIHR